MPSACSKSADVVGEPARCVERRCRVAHALSAATARAARAPSASLAVAVRRPPTTAGPERSGAASADMLAASPGSVRTPADGVGDARRILRGTTRPAPPASSSTRVREPGGDDRSAGGHRLDQHPGGDLLAGVVRQQHDVGLLHQLVQLGGRRGSASSKSTMSPTPSVGARSSLSRYASPSRCGTFGWVWPDHQVSRARVEVAQAGHGARSPTRCPCRDRADPRSG